MPDGLQITSLDTTNTFHIQSLVVDDPHFTLLHAPNDVDLPPSATDSFDLEFAPTDVGDFTATVSLFLDDDPDPTANVQVHGTAVFVDAHGAGGCQAGGGAGGAGGALLVAGVLAGAVRRRRRAARAASLGAVAAVAVLGVAHADSPTRDLDASVYHPMPSTGGSMFAVQSARVGADGDFAVPRSCPTRTSRSISTPARRTTSRLRAAR